MPTIGIANVSPLYDGEYELDLDIAFTTNEWRWIKQIASYSPTTLQSGVDDGDPSLFCALAVIAMRRAEKITREQILDVAETLADVPFDGTTITIVADEEVEDEIPPELTSAPAESSLSRPLDKSNGSGSDSSSASDLSDAIRVATGTLRSPTSATSHATTSER